MNLFDLRKEYGLSQLKAAEICSVPLRTYIRYESDNEYSLGMDEKDNFPISIVNYTDIESITKSIEQYYNDNGGRCS